VLFFATGRTAINSLVPSLIVSSTTKPRGTNAEARKACRMATSPAGEATSRIQTDIARLHQM
jgi:hypothetical protein